MNKLLISVAGIIILAVAGGYYLLSNRSSNTTPSSIQTQTISPDQTSTPNSFSNPKKSAHYESNTPEHASTLAGVPINIVINFNFDLAPPSSISIKKDNIDYGVSDTVIDSNKLAMRRLMKPDSPDGIYTVTYIACWPDKSCHDGYFQFKIDRSQSQNYQDFTNKKEVTVKMSEIKFNPQNIKISKGTKITWINDDEEEHYINTDSHPAHTYFPDQNSRVLSKGGKHSAVFDTTGIYPYHCSAHEATMKGSILVE